MKSCKTSLLRPIFGFLLALLILRAPNNAFADPNYYYIFTGFSGTCLDAGGGNVMVNGTFLRSAYLPANNVHNFSVSSPAATGSFSLGAVGTETTGQSGVFLSNHTSDPGLAPVALTVAITTQIGGVTIGSTTATITCTAVGASPIVTISYTYPVLGGAGSSINDGRLNTDAGAPAIVYRNPLRVVVYDSTTRQSQTVFTISQETIDDVGIPAANTVLATAKNPLTGHTITLYRLASGEFQLNTRYRDGKLYIFAWNEDATRRYYPAY